MSNSEDDTIFFRQRIGFLEPTTDEERMRRRRVRRGEATVSGDPQLRRDAAIAMDPAASEDTLALDGKQLPIPVDEFGEFQPRIGAEHLPLARDNPADVVGPDHPFRK